MSSSSAPISVRDCLILSGVALIWGTNTLFSKIAIDLVPPLAFLALRFCLTLILAGWMLKISKAKGQWRVLVLVALLTGPIHFGLQFIGVAAASDLSPMVIAMQLWVPFSVLFAAVALKEKIPPLRLFGMLISFAGIAVLAFEPSVLKQLDAFGLVAAAAAAYAAASVIMSRSGGMDPVQTQLWVAIISIPTLAFGSYGLEQGQVAAFASAPWIVWFALLFAAVLSGLIANSVMWTMLQKYPVSAVTPWLQLSPVSAVILGVLVLGDVVTVQLVIGIVTSLIGVLIVAVARKA